MQPQYGVVMPTAIHRKGENSEPKKEGVNSLEEETPAIDIDYSDKDLEDLSVKWKSLYESYYADIAPRVKNMQIYLRGDQFSQFTAFKSSIPFDEYPPQYNLLYECMEILAPSATKARPDPTVLLDDENTAETRLFAKHIKEICDDNNFQLENALRDRFPHLIGVLKVYVDAFENKIKITKINPIDILIDPRANVSNGVIEGEFVGQLVTITQAEAKRRFASKIDVITQYVGSDKFKKFTYIEWWTNNIVFQTCNGKLLDRFKNPYWNYDSTETTVDEFGNENPVTIPGENHLKQPPIPFVLVNIQNDGTRPHDVTSELEQAVPLQHAFDQMLFQINKNAQRCNGYVVGSGFTKENLKDVAEAGWNGGIILKGKGDEFDIKTGAPLPSFIFEHKMSLEVAIRNIFGVRGSSPQGVSSEQTVRGKIIMREQDGERTNTVTNRLELVCTGVFNLIAQLLYVTETINIKGLEIKAKPGSMIPKDSVTQRNEAVDLWAQKAIDPVSLFEKLDFPNPQEAAQKLVDFQMMPIMFASPQVQQAVAEQQQAAVEQTNQQQK
jgi:hypothetical protein